MTATARRLRFPGSTGELLAARLDLPAGPPRAFAVFAHCFTCGKDLRSVTRVAAGLTEQGIGVLRFDMTGLGQSGGDFANTDLSSNVDDLLAAANYLRDEFRAPQLLIGHSLGGAAALLAAPQLPELRAVATIGAPSDTSHLTHLFEESVDEIRGRGEAKVNIAGRGFTIRAEFLDDLERHAVRDAVAGFRGALLFLHSPIDQVVGVAHAAALYTAARHPKGFIGLDGADHLLSDPRDAAYAAEMIGAWANRHLRDEAPGRGAPEPTAQVVVAETTLGPFHNHVVAGSHHLIADEPEEVGGFDAGPSPYDLLAAALGACTSMTLRMYADRKDLPLDRVSVEVSHDQVHARDAATETDTKVDRFTRRIHLEGPLDEASRRRLGEIADRCPVHRTLERGSRIDTNLAAPDAQDPRAEET